MDDSDLELECGVSGSDSAKQDDDAAELQQAKEYELRTLAPAEEAREARFFIKFVFINVECTRLSGFRAYCWNLSVNRTD